MITIKRTDINEYRDFVRKFYPDFVEDYWFSHGELIFFRNQHDCDRGANPLSCYKLNGKLTITDEF